MTLLAEDNAQRKAHRQVQLSELAELAGRNIKDDAFRFWNANTNVISFLKESDMPEAIDLLRSGDIALCMDRFGFYFLTGGVLAPSFGGVQ